MPPSKNACHFNVILTAMAATKASEDFFLLLTTTELMKGSLVLTKKHLNSEEDEPSHCKFMLRCKDKVKWKAGGREKLSCIVKNKVWMKTSVRTGTKAKLLKWAYNLKRDKLGNIIGHKCRLVA
jgi:hypothetical protein